MSLEINKSDCDENFAAQKRSKQRQPKSRDKWSLLWFIPGTVLNGREETSGGKKGKRFGFDRFTQLSCKDCHVSFHSKETLVIHKSEIHGSKSSTAPVFPSSYQRPRSSPSSRLSRSFTAPTRRSSRRMNSSINYNDDNDDIEILDTDIGSYSPANSNKRRSSRKHNTSLNFEVLNLDDDDEDDVSEIVPIEPEISMVVDGDKEEEDDDITELVTVEPEIPKNVSKHVKITRLADKENDEVLLNESDDDDEICEIDIEDGNKRKRLPGKSSSNKKAKEDDLDELVEVKSSSGKTMKVKRSMLEKVMSSSSSPLHNRRRTMGA